MACVWECVRECVRICACVHCANPFELHSFMPLRIILILLRREEPDWALVKCLCPMSPPTVPHGLHGARCAYFTEFVDSHLLAWVVATQMHYQNVPPMTSFVHGAAPTRMHTKIVCHDEFAAFADQCHTGPLTPSRGPWSSGPAPRSGRGGCSIKRGGLPCLRPGHLRGHFAPACSHPAASLEGQGFLGYPLP